MRTFAYQRPSPVPMLCDRHSLVIEDLEKRHSTGKIIARVAPDDAQGDALASDAICS